MRHGFLLIDKPVGPTSHDIVNGVRRLLPERDIGHLGTLDPFASGLLVLAVGAKALKVIELFSDLPKEYVVTMKFGAVSTTYDIEGTLEDITLKPGQSIPDEMALRRVIEDRFLGTIEQAPPAHSAVHIEGKRSYEWARKGIAKEPPKREVTIARCDVESFQYPQATLRVACSTGTYIRSLVHDIGQVLRTGAYASALRRTGVREWNVEDAVKPENATWSKIIPLKDVLKDFPRLDLSTGEQEHVHHGRSIVRSTPGNTVIGWAEGLPIALLVPGKEGRGMRPRKVL